MKNHNLKKKVKKTRKIKKKIKRGGSSNTRKSPATQTFLSTLHRTNGSNRSNGSTRSNGSNRSNGSIRISDEKMQSVQSLVRRQQLKSLIQKQKQRRKTSKN